MSRLELCLMVEGQEGVSWPQWKQLANAAETHGFQGLFRSGHYLSELPGSGRAALECWGTICALAAVTSKIRLGTAMTPASFRHPSVLGKLVTTADHVSGGRVELGIGAGWFEEEHVAYGFPFHTGRVRMDVLEEQLEIITRSWGDEPFSFAGQHYEVTDLDAQPKPVQRPGPPIIIGGEGGPRSVALAARVADEYNTPDPTIEQIRKRRAAFVEACERAGRDPGSARFSVMAQVLVGTDRAELHRRTEAAARVQGIEEVDPTAYLKDFAQTGFAGTPDQVVEQLAEVAELGVQRVLLESPDHTDLEMIDLIGTEILPRMSG